MLDIDIRKKYQPTFDDSLIKIKGFSERFYLPPYPCPIFLDFDDGDMFWIREFDGYYWGREIQIYGRFLKKTEFVHQYLLNPNFFDIDELKVTDYHRVYEEKQKLLWVTRAELNAAMEELNVAKQQKSDKEHAEENQKINDEILKKEEQYNQKIKYQKEARKRQEIMDGFNKTINAYTLIKKENTF